MLGSTTGCWANGCSGFGMLVQAGRRCKAKNSPLCRARQPESWAPSGFLQNQPAASPLAEWNARIMQSNCAREEGMERRGEAALYTVSSGACTACVSSLEGFSREKGRLSRALAHGSPVWATGSHLYKHCIVFQCLCLPWAKDLWEFREGTGWITRLCHRPRATPGHCQSGAGHKHQRLVSLCLRVT